jgi:hypothetical protein
MSSDPKLEDGYGTLNTRTVDIMSPVTDLFSKVALDQSMESGRDIVIRPSRMSNEGPFEFKLEPDSESYIEPNTLRLYGRFKVLKSDGSNLDPFVAAIPGEYKQPADDNLGLAAFPGVKAAAATGDDVAVVDMAGHSLFNAIDVFSNDSLITSNTSQTMAFKAFIESHLTYGHDARTTHMQCELMHPDTAGHGNKTVSNEGYVYRRSLISGSAEVEFINKLHIDVMNIPKLYPPMMKLFFKFNRNSDAFTLVQPSNNLAKYKIEILELKLIIRKIRLNETLTSTHKLMLQKEPAIIPYKATSVKVITVGAALTSFYWQSVFNGTLPPSIIVFQVPTAAFQGTPPYKSF